MKKHNVPLPNAHKEKGSSSLDSNSKGKALLKHIVSQGEWIIDSGVTHHMGASKRYFSSLTHLKVPHIFVGGDTKVEVEGKCEVEMEIGSFKDVLYMFLILPPTFFQFTQSPTMEMETKLNFF